MLCDYWCEPFALCLPSSDLPCLWQAVMHLCPQVWSKSPWWINQILLGILMVTDRNWGRMDLVPIAAQQKLCDRIDELIPSKPKNSSPAFWETWDGLDWDLQDCLPKYGSFNACCKIATPCPAQLKQVVYSTHVNLYLRLHPNAGLSSHISFPIHG